MKVRQLAVTLTTAGFNNGTGLRQKDFAGEARVLLEFVRDQIRYVRDIADVETLHDPVTILNQQAGDCDDKCILLAALLLSIGFEHVQFVAIAEAPEQFTHVYCRTYVEGPGTAAWVDLEPTEPIPYGQTVPLGGVVEFLTQDV